MALVQYAYSKEGLLHLHQKPSHPLNQANSDRKRNVGTRVCNKQIPWLHLWPPSHCIKCIRLCQPMIIILRKPLHTASPRLQGMMIKLHHYHLDVIFKHGKELFVADALSRAHLSTSDPQHTDDLPEVITVQVLSSCRIDEIRAAVQKDVTCQQLADMIRNGWPASSK